MAELLELLPQRRPVGSIICSYNILLMLQLAHNVLRLIMHGRSHGRAFATHALRGVRERTHAFANISNVLTRTPKVHGVAALEILRFKRGTYSTVASSATNASARRRRLSVSASTTRSASRLNSAAPYKTHACPPIRRERTPCSRITKRTLCIGLGIKSASKGQIRRPQAAALQPSFGGTQAVPVRPLRAHEGNW